MAYKKILFRRDTAANWTSEDPVLAIGEIGLEIDTEHIIAAVHKVINRKNS